MEIHISGYLFALVGFTFSLLCRPGEVLDPWAKLINFLTKGLPKSLSSKIKKMLYECEKCVSGQIAFWMCVLYFKPPVMDAVFIICIAILTAYIIAKIDAITRILWM